MINKVIEGLRLQTELNKIKEDLIPILEIYTKYKKIDSIWSIKFYQNKVVIVGGVYSNGSYAENSYELPLIYFENPEEYIKQEKELQDKRAEARKDKFKC